jgi:hypothetical protein
MKKETRQILKDIYKLDESLKAHEESLVKMIERLQLAKPDIKIDETFVSQLRERLWSMEKAGESKVPFSAFGFRKLAYAFGALALVAAAAGSIVYFNLQEPEKLVLETGIESVGEKAFGDITFSADEAEEGALGRGGAGIPAGTAQNLEAPAPEKADSSVEMIREPRRINYDFVYQGEEIAVGESKMNVYGRISGGSMSSQLAGLLKGVSLDALDLGKLNNAQVGSLQINEDREYGYSIFIDPSQGMVAFSMNWEKWPQDAYQREMTEADRLQDGEALRIAGDFIKNYGISTDRYGEPEVLETGGVYYLEMSDGNYIPDSRSVIYPLLIDGKAVYDQSGRKTGINIEVSARYRKVTYAGNIFAAGFQGSSYDVETDPEKIVSSAEKGGINSYYKYSDPTETVTVELGTPSLELVRVWQMTENKYLGEELYVPAYLFPLTDQADKEYLYQGAVIVPLVGVEASGGRTEPMPMMDVEE